MLVDELPSKAETEAKTKVADALAADVRKRAEGLTARLATLDDAIGQFAALVADVAEETYRLANANLALDRLADDANITRPETPRIDAPGRSIAQYLGALLARHFQGGQPYQPDANVIRQLSRRTGKQRRNRDSLSSARESSSSPVPRPHAGAVMLAGDVFLRRVRMPMIQAVTVESASYGPIELTSHDFDSALTQLIVTLWTDDRCPRLADALQRHVESQRERGIGLCHAVALALVVDAPELRHYWSARRGGTDHSWVELADEALDTIWTINDEPVLNVMLRDVFCRDHHVIRPRRWISRCHWSVEDLRSR